MAKKLTEEQARTYIAELVPGLLHAFQLEHWDVHVFLSAKVVGRDPSTKTAAEVAVWPLSNYAEINVDAAMHASKQDLARSLRHELAHVLHVEFEKTAKLAWRTAGGKHARRILQEAYYDAAEQLVTHIERMFDEGLGISASALAGRGDRRRRRKIEGALK
jgi:hypothetical protein